MTGRYHIILLGLLALLIIRCPHAATVVASLPTHSARQALEALQPTPQQYRQAILNRMVNQPVSGVYTPVHLFCDGLFTGSGTLAELPDFGPVVFTAAQLFTGNRGAMRYSYRTLPDDAGPYNVVAATIPTDEATGSPESVALCRPGLVATDINLSGAALRVNELSARVFPVSGRPYVVSLTTSEECRVLAVMPDTEQLLIDYQPLYGEGGMGFVDSVGNLMVLVYTVPVNEQVRTLPGLNPRARVVTIVSMLSGRVILSEHHNGGR